MIPSRIRSSIALVLNARHLATTSRLQVVQLSGRLPLVGPSKGSLALVSKDRTGLVLPGLSKQCCQCFSSAKSWTDEEIKKVIDSDRLVVFMKGIPKAPQCGFSKYVIEIFRMHGMEKFVAVNVLEDEVLRSRIKEYTNWPTIPQVYMNGQFIGGFDILLQMHKNGELVEELQKIGHRSKLLDSGGEGESDSKK